MLAAAPLTLHANLGLTQNPAQTGERSRVGRVSTAVMWAAQQRLTWLVDAGVESNPDPARRSWPGTLLVGAIYTIRPGMDVDAGYRSSVGRSTTTSTHETLLGFTYRFSP